MSSTSSKDSRASSQSPWQTRWDQLALPAKAGEDVHLYALLDVAQDKSLLAKITAAGMTASGLFDFPRDSKVAAVMPWLVKLGTSNSSRTEPNEVLLAYVLDQVKSSPCATLIASRCDFSMLLTHLRRAIDVQLQGSDSMYLAFWDPAILGTLMGQTDSQSLVASDSVLDPSQCLALLGPIARWWFWDRAGKMHEYAPAGEVTGVDASQARSTGTGLTPARLPLALRKSQVDQLVESTVPDLLISYIRLNQRQLLDKLPPLSMHWFVRQQIFYARSYGLNGVRDLLNYTSVALLFGARFDQSDAMRPLLAQIKAGKLSMDKAMDLIDEAALSKDKQAAKVILDEKGQPWVPPKS